jgi:uncharacterized membrane protein
MKKRKTMLWAALISMLAVIAYGLYTYQYLPENMASHFDASFKADGWMDKYSYLISVLGVTVFMNIIFLGMGAVIRRIPESLINSPNKNYWLATEERKEELYAKITNVLYATAVLINFIFLFVHHMAYQYNVPEVTPRIPNAAVLPVVLSVTILFSFASIIWVFIGLKPRET